MNRAQKKKIANSHFYLQFAQRIPFLRVKIVDASMEKICRVPFFFFYHNKNPIAGRFKAIFHLLTGIDTVFSFFSFLDENPRVDGKGG